MANLNWETEEKMVPRETAVFRESPNVSREEVKGNIRTKGKTKLTSFPRDQTLSALSYIWTFPLRPVLNVAFYR